MQKDDKCIIQVTFLNNYSIILFYEKYSPLYIDWIRKNKKIYLLKTDWMACNLLSINHL